MKFLMIFIALMTLTIEAYGQERSPDLQLTREQYLEKSKAQGKTGGILLGVGTASIGLGLLLACTQSGDIGNDLSDGYYGALLITGGVITDLISIPFFTASAKNRRRASKVVTSIKVEDVPAWTGVSSYRSSVPALSLRVNF